jgi:hypothetical protein
MRRALYPELQTRQSAKPHNADGVDMEVYTD